MFLSVFLIVFIYFCNKHTPNSWFSFSSCHIALHCIYDYDGHSAIDDIMQNEVKEIMIKDNRNSIGI